MASALRVQFGILVKSALKMRCTKLSSRQSCYKSKTATFMLCNIFRYLAPFWSYSGLQNTSRKFCAVLRNKFFFLRWIDREDGKSTVLVMWLSVLISTVLFCMIYFFV